MQSKRKVIGILFAWGILTLGAFWNLEWQYLRPASRPVGAISAHPEKLPPSPLTTLDAEQGIVRLDTGGQVTWINFWNPDCPCSRYAEAQVQRLAAHYTAQGVQMITVIQCGTTAEEREVALTAWHKRGLSQFLTVADPQSRVARAYGVWAAPAAVVLDRHGRVAYVGAYNAARYCDNRETAWAAQALEAVTQNRLPSRPLAPFYGCSVLSSLNK